MRRFPPIEIFNVAPFSIDKVGLTLLTEYNYITGFELSSRLSVDNFDANFLVLVVSDNDIIGTREYCL